MSSSPSTAPAAASSSFTSAAASSSAAPAVAPASANAPRAFVPTTIPLDGHDGHGVLDRPDVLDRPKRPGAGDAVVLRPWSLKDLASPGLLDGLVTAAADPQTALWNPVRAADPSAAAQWIEARDKGWAADTAAAFALLDDDKVTTDPAGTAPALLGALTVRWTDRADGLAMIGYWLHPAARGRGLATRATIAATEWAFRTAGVRRLELAHAVENTPSCRVAHRCGFPAEGTLRASYRFGDGQYHDEHLHARLATDPAPAPGRPVQLSAHVGQSV